MSPPADPELIELAKALARAAATRDVPRRFAAAAAKLVREGHVLDTERRLLAAERGGPRP